MAQNPHHNQTTTTTTTTNLSYHSFAEITPDESHNFIHILPANTSQTNVTPWMHYMHDLDDFFIRLYKYHQKSGFLCLICGQLLELVQIVYSVFLPIFFLNYVDYDVFFKNKPPPNSNNNTTNPITPTKVHIYDIVKPYNSVTIPPIQLFAIFLAFVFLVWKSVKTLHSLVVNLAIKQFYKDVLHIKDCSSLTWQDVQTRLINSREKFLAQDSHLTELDVHNRILRHSNYMIAIINKGLLPIIFPVPFMGKTVFFTQSFLYNCQLLFFRGPFKCIFDRNWILTDDVKNSTRKLLVASRLNRNILILAAINLCLSPILLIWQVLYFFYSNVALVKKDPVVLGLRNWSLYSRWFFRHFNELDHQLNERLNHAYKPTRNYMDAFTSPLVEVVARFVRFITGSTFAILLFLTIWDGDVIQTDHVFTVITGLWLTWSAAGGLISPEIPPRFTKSELYEQILQHTHYVPHNYPPFTPQAKSSMSEMFQYKILKLFEDLLSTLATPYIMVRHLKPRSIEIVDFFRNYTVEVPGVGDICVFSMMNIRENGNPMWQPQVSSPQTSLIASKRMKQKTRVDPAETFHDSGPVTYHDVGSVMGDGANFEHFERETMHNHALPMQAEHGKLELSLINFKLQNPSWIPSHDTQREFIEQVTSQALEQASMRTDRSHLEHTESNQRIKLSTTTTNPNDVIDSSTAISLSTLFLHEHARLSMSANMGTSSSQQQKPPRETDPLL